MNTFKKKKRVIVDTNCWISFLIGKKLTSLFYLLSHDCIELILCEELLDEIQEVTQRPKFAKYFPENEVKALLSFLRLKGIFLEPTEDIHLCRDSEDDFLLDLAQTAKAHYLITGDKDLLVIQKIGSCKIVDAKTFEEEIK